MKNLKVRQKLILSFMIIAMITSIVGVVGVAGLITLNENEATIYRLGINTTTASNMAANMQEQRVLFREVIMNMSNEELLESIFTHWDELNVEYREMAAYLEANTRTARGREYVNEIAAAYEAYDATKDPLKRMVESTNYTGARMVLDSAAPPLQILMDSLHGLNEYAMELGDATNNTDEAIAYRMIAIVAVLAAISIVVAIVLGLYNAKLISDPLVALTAFMSKAGSAGDIAMSRQDEVFIERGARAKDEIGQCVGSTAKFIRHMIEVSKMLEIVSAGDFSKELELLSDKDVMGISLNKLIASFNTMFGEIHAASGQVTVGAAQVSQGAQGLASGSSQQAASIQQFSAALAEMQDMVRQSAENSIHAREANGKTTDSLKESIRSMSEMLEAMKSIDESSANITKVIKVIDDIAFQTNILALNAAVEAARAGQHGKGFAVVADEVRNLASKSAAAAKETAVLIDGSTDRVKQGNEIVARTNADLELAAASAQESTGLINAMAEASTDQARTITEINLGMGQISSVVQANSATAEESAAAAQQMSAQAVVLEDIVSRFKLSGVTLDPPA